MTKIVLPNATVGNSLNRVNDNFSIIEDALNNGALWRNNPAGEPNEMLNDLDMNGQRIYNLPVPTLDHEAARYKDIKDMKGVLLEVQQASEDAQDAAERAENAAIDAEGSETATEAMFEDMNKRYLGAAATDPLVDLNGDALVNGAMYFNTTNSILRIYSGGIWIDFDDVEQAFIKRPVGGVPIIATAGQTVFPVPGGYTPSQMFVALNGEVLVNGTQVDLSSGTNIVLASPATAGDRLDYYIFIPFNVANTLTIADANAAIAAGDSATLFSANAHSDAQDIVTLDAAEVYADAQDVTNLASANTYTDTGLSNAFGGSTQTLQDVTASRALNVGSPYTNSTGRPIIVYVAMSPTAAGQYLSIRIAGTAAQGGFSTAAGAGVALSCIIPPGQTYDVIAPAGPTLSRWREYR